MSFCSVISTGCAPAIGGVTDVNAREAVGVVETFSVATCIEAADFAVKAAGVTLIRLHMAYGIGGKCYFVMSGDVADVETAKKPHHRSPQIKVRWFTAWSYRILIPISGSNWSLVNIYGGRSFWGKIMMKKSHQIYITLMMKCRMTAISALS